MENWKIVHHIKRNLMRKFMTMQLTFKNLEFFLHGNQTCHIACTNRKATEVGDFFFSPNREIMGQTQQTSQGFLHK